MMARKRAGEYALGAFGTCVCVLVLVAATSGPSFAGGSHGHNGGHGHHFGHGYHHGHGGHYYGAAAILGLSTLALGLRLYDTRYYPGFPRWITNLMTCLGDSAIRINAIPSSQRAIPVSPGG